MWYCSFQRATNQAAIDHVKYREACWQRETNQNANSWRALRARSAAPTAKLVYGIGEHNNRVPQARRVEMCSTPTLFTGSEITTHFRGLEFFGGWYAEILGF